MVPRRRLESFHLVQPHRILLLVLERVHLHLKPDNDPLLRPQDPRYKLSSLLELLLKPVERRRWQRAVDDASARRTQRTTRTS